MSMFAEKKYDTDCFRDIVTNIFADFQRFMLNFTKRIFKDLFSLHVFSQLSINKTTPPPIFIFIF